MSDRSRRVGGLESLGWCPFFEAERVTLDASLLPARVVWAQRATCRVLDADGVHDAIVRGKLYFEQRDAVVAAGDWVAVRHHADGARVVEHVFRRRTAFVRKAAGRAADAQVVAANVDLALVVTSVGSDVNARRIERYLAMIAQSGASAVVVLGKIDLCDDAATDVDIVRAAAPSVPVVAASALRGDGVDAIRALAAPARTLALLGSSGVGKSALVNALLHDERMAVGAIREHDGRGRHTTTHRELFLLPTGGLVLDTPGMRELSPWASEGETFGFDDIDELATGCRFRDCRHAGEPGCRVAEAIEEGSLDPGRLASWDKLAREQAHLRRRVDARAAVAAKQRAKQLGRAGRERMRAKRGE